MPALLLMQKREVMYGPQTAMEFEGNGSPAASGEPSPQRTNGQANHNRRFSDLSVRSCQPPLSEAFSPRSLGGRAPGKGAHG